MAIGARVLPNPTRPGKVLEVHVRSIVQKLFQPGDVSCLCSSDQRGSSLILLPLCLQGKKIGNYLCAKLSQATFPANIPFVTFCYILSKKKETQSSRWKMACSITFTCFARCSSSWQWEFGQSKQVQDNLERQMKSDSLHSNSFTKYS